MCRKVKVVHYESIENDNGETIEVANGLFTETVINEDYIVTATNKRVLAKENGAFDICKIDFINGKSIDIFNNVHLRNDGTIFFNDSIED